VEAVALLYFGDELIGYAYHARNTRHGWDSPHLWWVRMEIEPTPYEDQIMDAIWPGQTGKRLFLNDTYNRAITPIRDVFPADQ
jgi:hypothetical protein